MGRRINKKVSNSGPLNTEGDGDFFYYDGNRLLEHHHDAATSGEDYLREYVWGLEYIDEAVAQYDSQSGQAAELFFILIDANYNVVAIVDAGNGSTPPGTLVQQYNYWPYGTLLAAEDGNGATIDFETYPEQIATNAGHQGLYWDFETWLIHNRARTYGPHLGRYYQRDPNETGLVITLVLTSNAHAVEVLDSMSHEKNLAHGSNLYQYLSSNPLRTSDPSGQLSLIELLYTTSKRLWVRGMVFGMMHPAATAIAKAVLAGSFLYAFIVDEQMQAMVMSQPDPLGVLSAAGATVWGGGRAAVTAFHGFLVRRGFLQPFGFTAESWMRFGGRLYRGIMARLGTSQAFLKGSSVSGYSFSSGTPIGKAGPGDVDIAIVSRRTMDRLRGMGYKDFRSGGARTGPLSRDWLKSLGLEDEVIALEDIAGQSRPVSIMIYESTDAVYARGCEVLPLSASSLVGE